MLWNACDIQLTILHRETKVYINKSRKKTTDLPTYRLLLEVISWDTALILIRKRKFNNPSLKFIQFDFWLVGR